MKNVIMKVEKNITSQFFNEVITSINMWCTENCSGRYDIKIYEAPKYNFPTEVKVIFSREEDATYFKLCPLWMELIQE